MADLTRALSGVQAVTYYEPGGAEMSEQFIDFTLEVVAPPGWFLTLDTLALRVVKGDLAVLTVTATARGGYDSPLSLSLLGLPPGVVATITPSSIPPTGTATISIPTGAIPEGTILPLRLRGVGV